MPCCSWIVWICNVYNLNAILIVDVTRAYVDEPIVVAAINNSDGFTALSNVEDVAITTIDITNPAQKRMPWRYLMLGIERAAFKS